MLGKSALGYKASPVKAVSGVAGVGKIPLPPVQAVFNTCDFLQFSMKVDFSANDPQLKKILVFEISGICKTPSAGDIRYSQNLVQVISGGTDFR